MSYERVTDGIDGIGGTDAMNVMDERGGSNVMDAQDGQSETYAMDIVKGEKGAKGVMDEDMTDAAAEDVVAVDADEMMGDVGMREGASSFPLDPGLSYP